MQAASAICAMVILIHHLLRLVINIFIVLLEFRSRGPLKPISSLLIILGESRITMHITDLPPEAIICLLHSLRPLRTSSDISHCL